MSFRQCWSLLRNRRRNQIMLMAQYIHRRMIELLQKSYPDDYEKYSHFFIQIKFTEKKGNYSKYIFGKKMLVITTLSRRPSDIFLSMVLELAHHIDVVQRRETHEDRVYLCIVRKLLDTAFKQNMILMSELYHTDIKKLKNTLQQNFGSFSNWKYEPRRDSEHVYILVFDAFMIKNLLKTNGYQYDPDQQAWSKFISMEDYANEEHFLNQYQNRADFKVIKDNSFYIRPCYCLKVETYSIQDKELWKALSYRYDASTKKWVKNIYADELKIELEMIQELPKQRITISQIKNK